MWDSLSCTKKVFFCMDHPVLSLLQVHAILRKIVARTLESDDCKGMAQFTHLQRDIARTASEALDLMRVDARKMVTTMVEMERSYLTAEVFKEILQADGRSGEGGELIRTLSGRQVQGEGGDGAECLQAGVVHLALLTGNARCADASRLASTCGTDCAQLVGSMLFIVYHGHEVVMHAAFGKSCPNSA